MGDSRPRRRGHRHARAAQGRAGGSKSSPRVAAVHILDNVAYRGRSLSDQLSGLRDAGLSPRDRALTQELCFGVLRWFHRLEALASGLLSRPLRAKDRDLYLLILMGMYQLLSTRTPPHAAISETVQGARLLGKNWATGLVNGVLRAAQRTGDTLMAGADRQPETRYSQPPWLLQRVRAAWPERWESVLSASVERPPMTLRVNARRTSREAYQDELLAAGLAARAVAGVDQGLVLETPVDVSRIHGFVQGLVSVQDAGAQLAAPLLDVQRGHRVLDACAAPGGKTCHLLESGPEAVLLTAIDIDPVRLTRVRSNLERLGLVAEVCVGDASMPRGDWAERG